MILNIIFTLNGVYDILCAMSILKIIYIPFLDKIHLSMFNNYENNPLFERFIAYWIFTYGIIRITNNHIFISLSYFIEAVFFLHEYIHCSMDTSKTNFVIISSIALGILSIIAGS